MVSVVSVLCACAFFVVRCEPFHPQDAGKCPVYGVTPNVTHSFIFRLTIFPFYDYVLSFDISSVLLGNFAKRPSSIQCFGTIIIISKYFVFAYHLLSHYIFSENTFIIIALRSGLRSPGFEQRVIYFIDSASVPSSIDHSHSTCNNNIVCRYVIINK